MQITKFRLEQPVITASLIENEKDLANVVNQLLTSYTPVWPHGLEGEVGRERITLEGSTLRIDGLLVANVGDYIVWNQRGETYLVNTHGRTISSSDLPSQLLQPLVTKMGARPID